MQKYCAMLPEKPNDWSFMQKSLCGVVGDLVTVHRHLYWINFKSCRLHNTDGSFHYYFSYHLLPLS